MQTNWEDFADRAIAGDLLERDEARAILRAGADAMPALIAAAFRVRRTFFGLKVQLHVLENAKRGGCSEDCGFCAQSRHYAAGVDEQTMHSVEELVAGAAKAKQVGAYRYCMVTATYGPSARDLDIVCEAARRIKAELDLSLCASLGFLTADKAARLKQAGIDRFNHNLETGERFFPRVVTTHRFEDRVATIEIAKAAGLETCSGGIIGMGESEDDVLDLAYKLRELDTDSVPINFLDPRPGTPLAATPRIEPVHALRVLALIRLLNPRADVRVAGGREVTLRGLQPMALYIVSSMFTGGYLTTSGALVSDDHQMIRDVGFEVELHGIEMTPPQERMSATAAGARS